MKNVTIRKVEVCRNRFKYIFSFSKKAKELLENCNCFTNCSIIAYVTFLLKNEFNKNKIPYTDIEPNVNLLNYDLKKYNDFFKNTKDKNLIDKIDKVENYWADNGIYVKEKFYKRLIPIEKQYVDLIDLINDMNESFENCFK